MAFQFGTTPTTTSTTGTSGGGFTLGATAAPTFGASTGLSPGVFSFGNFTTAPNANAPAPGTNPTFGSLAGSQTGFTSFAAPISSASTTSGGSLFGNVAPASTTSVAPGGFSFTTPAATTSTNLGLKPSGGTLSFSTPAMPIPSSAVGTTVKSVQFGQPQTSAPALNFSTPATATTAASTFSLTGAASGPVFNLGTTAVSSAPNAAGSGFNLGSSLSSTQPTAATTVKLPTAVIPSTGFSPAAPSTVVTSAAPSLGFGTGLNFMSKTTSAATSTATGLSIPAPTLGGLSFNTTTAAPSITAPSTLLAPSSTISAVSTGLGGSSALTLSSATVSTTTSSSDAQQAAKAPTSMTYSQLEEHINKWTLELEEQEKIFLNQATQVNAWDRMLLESGDKISSLNTTIENLKIEQGRLELELDYIMSQERELEEAISPIEKAVASMTVTDSERQQVYELAANLDSQTKQMAEQLKETIDHLNELNRAQDENNPVIQISRILNAHMNSLQWIEQTANSTQSQLEETAKMIEMMKKDAEHPYNVSGYFI
jgi:nuclear pore complex protein Nup62